MSLCFENNVNYYIYALYDCQDGSKERKYIVE